MLGQEAYDVLIVPDSFMTESTTESKSINILSVQDVKTYFVINAYCNQWTFASIASHVKND